MKINTHRLTATDPGQRGREYGRAAEAEIHRAIELYRTHFTELGLAESTLRDAGVAAVDAVSAWRPEAAAELLGVADGAGVRVPDLGVLTHRTEVLALAHATPDECSAVAVVPADGSPWSMQTWDWNPRLAPTGLLLEIPLSSGRVVRTFTEPGMPGKIGVNTAGLGLQFNILHHSADGADIGVGVHCIARAVLEEASTLEEAREIASAAPASASSVLTVLTVADSEGGTTGAAGCLEITPAGVDLLPATDGFVAHTNHLLADSLADGDRSPSITTSNRLDHLTRLRDDLVGTVGLAERAAVACGGLGPDAPICIAADPRLPVVQQSATLLTIGTDPAAAALDWCPGAPSEVTVDAVRRFAAT